MRYRTAVKTGRSAAMQADALSRRSFSAYVEMAQRLASGYVRPLNQRLAPAYSGSEP